MEKKRNKIWLMPYTLIVLICVMPLYSCNGAMKNYKRADVEANILRRIAVLPLENLTPNEYADEKIRSLVIMDLLSRDVDTIEPGEVMRVFRELCRAWEIC